MAVLIKAQHDWWWCFLRRCGENMKHSWLTSQALLCIWQDQQCQLILALLCNDSLYCYVLYIHWFLWLARIFPQLYRNASSKDVHQRGFSTSSSHQVTASSYYYQSKTSDNESSGPRYRKLFVHELNVKLQSLFLELHTIHKSMKSEINYVKVLTSLKHKICIAALKARIRVYKIQHPILPWC